jgi:hypothetical protein
MSITSTTTGRVDRDTGRTHSAHSARKNRALWALGSCWQRSSLSPPCPSSPARTPRWRCSARSEPGSGCATSSEPPNSAGAAGLLIPRLAGLTPAPLAADMAGASIINIAVLHSAAVALTIPLRAALALRARARWEHATKFLAARTGR